MRYADDPDGAAERLEELALYENSELGELWEKLGRLWRSYRDYVSDDMRAALRKEVIAEAERTHTQFRLVEREETHTIKVTDLEFTGEDTP